MKGKLVERDSSFLIEGDRRFRVIAVAQVGLVTAGRNFKARVSVGSQRRKSFEEIESRERPGRRHAFAGARRQSRIPQSFAPTPAELADSPRWSRDGLGLGTEPTGRRACRSGTTLCRSCRSDPCLLQPARKLILRAHSVPTLGIAASAELIGLPFVGQHSVGPTVAMNSNQAFMRQNLS